MKIMKSIFDFIIVVPENDEPNIQKKQIKPSVFQICNFVGFSLSVSNIFRIFAQVCTNDVVYVSACCWPA